MANVTLNWTNAYLVDNEATIPTLTQVIERKIGDAVDWEELALVPVEGAGNAFSAVDEALAPIDAETNYQYRIVTVNGAVRTNGNIVTVSVPAQPSADPVEDLTGTYNP